MDWRRVRLRCVGDINPPTPEFGALPADRGVTFLPLEAIWPDALDTSRVRAKRELESGYTRFREGDVLVPKITPTFEASRAAMARGLLDGVGCGTTELHVLRPRTELDTRFLFYVTHSRRFLQEGAGAMQGVAGQKRVPESVVADYLIDLPPLEQQRRIADFLDRETTRIDALIRRNRELVRLVELRRGALRANAVLGRSGGFADRLATGDSTLPELPGGWRPVRLRHVACEITVGVVVTPAAYYVDEGFPFIRGFNVKPGSVTDEDLARIGPEGNSAHPKSVLGQGDVLVVRTGQAGAASVVPDWAIGGNCVDVLILRCGPLLRPRFLEAVLNSEPSSLQIEAMSVGAIQSHFNVSALRELVLPLPPVDEQDRVLSIIDEADARMVALVELGERQIGLLRERRQTMISAAVSGQLSVGRAA